MNKSHARDLLHDMHEVLESIGLKHFIIDGTLLGAVREGDFIRHDNDMDFGVFAEEWTKEILQEVKDKMAAKNIAVYHEFGIFEKCFEIAFMRESIKCDLFFYRRDGDKRIFHAFLHGGEILERDTITYEYPAELIENIRPMIFQMEYYPAPADPVRVLEIKYGPDWKVPIVKWDWARGPLNIRKK
jgi:hypothetical protein